MPAERTCPRCRTALAADALEGLCPTCVGRAAFASEMAGDAGEAALSPEIKAEFARLKPEEAGERIGPYKLMEQIGQGGFGTVWVADQEKPVRRRVALKIIKLGMDTKEVIARFEQERQALAMMDHPHIAKVLDAGATQWGRPFFVMELVRGIKITDYCDQANLPTAERLALFIQVCNAVQHAHQKGIIHRDLKPSNILVTLHDGVPVPKVIDFGVAKATQQQRLTELTIYTQFQQMIGTPLYMSPEQAEMSGLDIDTRSDIYSLGVLLYELLTGRTPFDPEELMRQGLDEIRRTIREQEPQTPSMFVQTMAADVRTSVAQHRQSDPAKLSGLLRGDLDWIVMKALEKDRGRRYETATGLARDIERHLADEPVHARPASRLYRFRRLVKRNKLVFAASAAVALALLLAVFTLAVSTMRVIKEKNQREIALEEKAMALEEAKAQLFSSLLNQARARRLSGRMGQRFDSLQAITEAARIRFDERLRDEAIAAMALPDVRPRSDWNFDGYYCFDGAYQLSAKLDEKGIITILSVPDGRELRRIETGSLGHSLSFSGDGRFLAQYKSSAHELRVWRVTDGQSVFGQNPVDYYGDFDFSADSRRLAIAQSGPKDWIACFDLESGEQTKRWEVSPHAMSLSFHPDSRQLAVGYIFGGIVSVYDAVEGTKLTDLKTTMLGTTIVKWHPDGRRLAVGHDAIQMWDVPAKRQLATMEGHVTGISALSFHPNGEILSSRGDEAVCRVWQPATGRRLLQFPGANRLDFSADGRSLAGAVIGEGARLLEVAAGNEHRTFVSSLGVGKDRYYNGALSPDGRFLAVGTDDGVRLWGMESGNELAFLPIGMTHSVFFLKDSTGLLTCGDGGLQRWPIANVEDTAAHVRVGPPRKIWLSFAPTYASSSQDGATLAVGGKDQKSVLIVDIDTESIQGSVSSSVPCEIVRLSPDARWLATTDWGSHGVQLWDVQTGKLRKQWDELTRTGIWFTPDGRTLVLSRPEEFSFWDVQTLQLVQTLRRGGVFEPGRVVFTPDGKLMAMELVPGMISLNEVATGRTVARLENPYDDSEGTRWKSFDSAGTQLVTASASSKAIHVWDLRAVRMQLKQMALDWDWPPFPPDETPRETRTLFEQAQRRIEVISAAVPLEATPNAATTRFFLHAVETARLRRSADPSALLAALEHLRACYATEGRDAETVPLLAESSALLPADTFLAQKVTTLQAWFAMKIEHAATSRRALELAAETDDPSVADRAAKGYCLLPSADPQLLATALTLARRAVGLGKTHQYLSYYQMALGMAEYRSGSYPAADEALTGAELAGKDNRHVRDTARLFHAMSLFRQGKAAEGRTLFAEVEAQMKPLPADEQQPFAGSASPDDLIVWLAYKEAKTLLRSSR